MQRRLRVCCELPPRHSRGEASSSSTDWRRPRAPSARRTARRCRRRSPAHRAVMHSSLVSSRDAADCRKRSAFVPRGRIAGQRVVQGLVKDARRGQRCAGQCPHAPARARCRSAPRARPAPPARARRPTGCTSRLRRRALRDRRSAHADSARRVRQPRRRGAGLDGRAEAGVARRPSAAPGRRSRPRRAARRALARRRHRARAQPVRAAGQDQRQLGQLRGRDAARARRGAAPTCGGGRGSANSFSSSSGITLQRLAALRC